MLCVELSYDSIAKILLGIGSSVLRGCLRFRFGLVSSSRINR